MEMRGRIDKNETWAPAQNDKNVKMNQGGLVRRWGSIGIAHTEQTHTGAQQQNDGITRKRAIKFKCTKW